MKNLDWNHARALLATTETGSLSAAARKLGLSQPTLSRQIAALETDLDTTLFERLGKRLVLTDAGTSLLPHLHAMGAAAETLALAASGRSEDVAGRVTISASDGYAAHVLPGILARIRAEAPQITISIISSDGLSDLRRREADIAIRHLRPQGDGLIARLVRDSTARFYAASDWLARHPYVRSLSDLRPDHLVGFEDVAEFTTYLRDLGVVADAADLRLVSKSSVVVWEMVRRGLGVSLMMDEIARTSPGMVAIFPDFAPIPVPVWLVTHRELRTSRRIRLVFDILAEELPRAGRGT
ncbi:MAG: LysR family transcriptional regulator [Paracoccus sp. (in: a-proteobacteria)]|uniref:LysR family transcriptional regulator n=1 Tax=Paracoccus sp. TaxID=267 RepID=UPI0026DEB2A5|nr:LysR family transcriptional regulator [Paracoccus sp. (in: a-proteobacteria)]MDO5631962.1 LysR family transcriptional regulator [Paracoccus sp. (in: a-proteobacteria)]